MRDAGVMGEEGRKAEPGDLVIALRAKDRPSAEAALAAARAQLDAPKKAGKGASEWAPRSIRAAIKQAPDANLALISVPGAFAAAEGRKALARGLNVMMFSDNVPLEDEIALKREAQSLGLLVMGPDCGTAIINGTPLAFANVVPRGDIGIVGASGTGIQEVSCLIANNGGGISHAIGTGGRDLKAEVGGTTALMAIDLLDADPATRHIVIISKPPAASVAAKVIDRVARSTKSFTLCFIGGSDAQVPANAKAVATLKDAAAHALGRAISELTLSRRGKAKGRGIRGLFAGGTMCAEAQVVLRDAGLAVASNVPIPGVGALPAAAGAHTLLDLGDDAFTQGRPHPMIEPAVRDQPLVKALGDPSVGVILIDFVLGYGAHADPAGHLASVLKAAPSQGAIVIASVTGTEDDPQVLSRQVATLEAAGVVVAGANADAARMAVAHVKG
jgi:FdrA protein